MSMTRSLVPAHIAALVPYQPGRPIAEVQRELGLDDVVKLASNENPWGPSPRALEAARSALANVHLYPDVASRELREALARRYGVAFGNTIVGAGSEGIMASVVRTFLHGDDEVLTSEGTFIGFMVLARAQGVRIRTAPLKDWGYDLEALADAISSRTKLIYLANPNNPTGTLFTRAEFERFYQRVPAHVLIIQDEAYHEFVPPSDTYPDSQLYRYDNVITLRTFSKAHGLAGLRVGYGLAAESLIEPLLKVKLPFEPGTVATAAALAALEDTEHLDRTVVQNRLGLERMMLAFRDFGLDPVPSHGNFAMVPMGSAGRAQRLTDALLRMGLIIRPLGAFGLPDCVRISVGTPGEVDCLLAALPDALAEAS
ncbi:MAG: histidinol-phosphate transaminase [Candidatus Sericytochromatia bacterium]|nr:histidinol-phosphate transaminase [Candidatus Sericytochromatia bacterium]